MADAVLGSRVRVGALDGDLDLELKPGTQSADIITIKDRGVSKLRGGGRSDLKIGVQVVTPTKLSGKEQELIRQFAGSHKAKAPHLAEFQQGLFAKLRDRFLNV